jgi:NADPH-dependent 7-cyano-7-deazaguanine reductase QueF
LKCSFYVLIEFRKNSFRDRNKKTAEMGILHFPYYFQETKVTGNKYSVTVLKHRFTSCCYGT